MAAGSCGPPSSDVSAWERPTEEMDRNGGLRPALYNEVLVRRLLDGLARTRRRPPRPDRGGRCSSLVGVVEPPAATVAPAAVVVVVPPEEPATVVVVAPGVVVVVAPDAVVVVVPPPDEPIVVVAIGWNLYVGWVAHTAGVARQPDSTAAG